MPSKLIMKHQLTTTLRQLGGMIRYEFLRNWRRKGLPMMMIIWLVAVIWGTTLFSGPTFFQPSADLRAGSALIRKIEVTLNILIASGGISTVFATFTLSILAAEIIPIDRQLGVMEWFNALPMRSGVYLAGKLLGLATTVLSCLIGVSVISGIAHYFLIGPYGLTAYVRMWLGAITGIALYMSAISALLTSSLRSRRGAAFVGLGLAVIGYIYLMPGVIQIIANGYTDFFLSNAAAMNAEACRLQAASCGRDLMAFELFPDLVLDMNRWLWQLLIVLGVTAVFAWAWQVKTQNR